MGMTDAISRSAAMNFLLGLTPFADKHECARALAKIPALDVAPVVRCSKCKHRCTFVCPMYHTEVCLDDLDGFDDYNIDRTDDDGFCHLGEEWTVKRNEQPDQRKNARGD